jgi:hypothetical protein
LCCINKKISTGHNTSFTIHCLHIILYTIIWDTCVIQGPIMRQSTGASSHASIIYFCSWSLRKAASINFTVDSLIERPKKFLFKPRFQLLS